MSSLPSCSVSVWCVCIYIIRNHFDLQEKEESDKSVVCVCFRVWVSVYDMNNKNWNSPIKQQQQQQKLGVCVRWKRHSERVKVSDTWVREPEQFGSFVYLFIYFSWLNDFQYEEHFCNYSNEQNVKVKSVESVKWNLRKQFNHSENKK